LTVIHDHFRIFFVEYFRFRNFEAISCWQEKLFLD
jgi:hypothetical protein